MLSEQEKIDFIIQELKNLNIKYLGREKESLIFEFPKTTCYINFKHTFSKKIENYQQLKKILIFMIFYNPSPDFELKENCFYNKYFHYFPKNRNILIDFTNIFDPSIFIKIDYSNERIGIIENQVTIRDIEDKTLKAIAFDICQSQDPKEIGILEDYIKEKVLNQ